MFKSTIDLITLAISIILLLIVSSKSTSRHDQDSVTPRPTVSSRKRNDIKRGNARIAFGKNNALKQISEVPYVNRVASNNDEDDDELRRRVEEFINKINRSWKAEKLRTSPYSLQ